MELLDGIAGRIHKHGPVSFHEFMQWCLYDPELGYYTSKYNPIGTEGDFYTSPMLTPVFGALLGKQIEEMWEQMGRSSFTIVEYGAGTGHLCLAIIDYLKSNSMMYARLRYCNQEELMKEKGLI